MKKGAEDTVQAAGSILTITDKEDNSPKAITFSKVRMDHTAAFFVLFCSVCLFKATTQLARGLGHVRRFVAYGLINALVMVVSAYLLLFRARLGVEGYLWSFTIGYLVGGVAAFVGSAEYRLLVPFRVDRVLLRRMLAYSLPLVPNLLSWWFVSVSGRYVVLWHSGVVAAGLFTAASKMPSLINIVASVFQIGRAHV